MSGSPAPPRGRSGPTSMASPISIDDPQRPVDAWPCRSGPPRTARPSPGCGSTVGRPVEVADRVTRQLLGEVAVGQVPPPAGASSARQFARHQRRHDRRPQPLDPLDRHRLRLADRGTRASSGPSTRSISRGSRSPIGPGCAWPKYSTSLTRQQRLAELLQPAARASCPAAAASRAASRSWSAPARRPPASRRRSSSAGRPGGRRPCPGGSALARCLAADRAMNAVPSIRLPRRSLDRRDDPLGEEDQRPLRLGQRRRRGPQRLAVDPLAVDAERAGRAHQQPLDAALHEQVPARHDVAAAASSVDAQQADDLAGRTAGSGSGRAGCRGRRPTTPASWSRPRNSGQPTPQPAAPAGQPPAQRVGQERARHAAGRTGTVWRRRCPAWRSGGAVSGRGAG